MLRILCLHLYLLFSLLNLSILSAQQENKSALPQNSEFSTVTPSKNVETEFEKYIHWNPEGSNRVGYLYIGDHESSINQSTWLYINQGLEYFKKNPPIFIILEIDTPGGEVFSAQKISDALKEIDTQYNIPVVAYINNWAISAGAMIAYASRFITTVKDGSMGAAEPVLAGDSGKMESASEKVNSALRSDFASRAGFFDRNPLIAEAMVDKDLILVIRQGKIIRLDNENQIRYEEPHADIVISPKGKLLTLDAKKMVEYGVADLLLNPMKLAFITEADRSKGEWSGEKMALFHTPFFSSIPQVTIDAYKMDWKTRFFAFLANPLVSSLLFMGLMLGAYLELQNPGLSLPGLVAASCLFLITLSSFAMQLGNWLELILVLTGLALILIDLFVFPTLGILLGLGGILFIIGLLGLLIPGIGAINFEYDTQTLNAAGEFVMERMLWLFGAFVLTLIIIALLSRYLLPHFKGFQRFVLQGNEQDASRGYIAPNAAKDLPQPGAEGTVLATLRPAGKVIIANDVYDAISYGGLIEAEEAIVVLRLEGSIIVVGRKEGKLTI